MEDPHTAAVWRRIITIAFEIQDCTDSSRTATSTNY